MGKAVVVRYCGGCNPRYDRVGAVEELRRRFPEADFVTEHPAPAATLLVCGCAVQCIARDCGAEALRLTDRSELEGVAAALEKALDTPGETREDPL